MFETIEKLRDKPESTKKKIAFLISLIVVLIIFVIWLSVIYPDFKKSKLRDESISKIEPSPVSAFTDSLSSGLSSISEQFNKIKEVMSSFSTSAEYYTSTTTSDNNTANVISGE